MFSYVLTLFFGKQGLVVWPKTHEYCNQDVNTDQKDGQDPEMGFDVIDPSDDGIDHMGQWIGYGRTSNDIIDDIGKYKGCR